MPIPLPVLDNRRFDDLVAEAQQRLASHTPELTRVMPGDPASAFIDVFAWLTETIIYRANLIPERQRLAFLNLLQLPLRSATAARGVICIDSQAKNALLPPVLPSGSALKAGKISLSTVGDLQATPLQLTVVGKQPVSTADLTAAGITQAQLLAQYGQPVSAFRPTTFVPGTDALSLSSTLDHALYLALSVPSSLSLTPDAMRLRRRLVEHPFGTIKAWMGSTHFQMKRLPNVKTEISLHVLAYNLKRVIAILGAKPLIAAIQN